MLGGYYHNLCFYRMTFDNWDRFVVYSYSGLENLVECRNQNEVESSVAFGLNQREITCFAPK
jgi:hypothetical protein